MFLRQSKSKGSRKKTGGAEVFEDRVIIHSL